MIGYLATCLNVLFGIRAGWHFANQVEEEAKKIRSASDIYFFGGGSAEPSANGSVIS